VFPPGAAEMSCPAVRRNVAPPLAWRIFCLLLAVAAFLPMANARAEQIRSVEWTPIAVGGTPAPDARWLTFELPHRWTASEGTPLQGVAMRMKFDLKETPADAWAVLLTTAPDGGRVSVNGRFIGAIPMPHESTEVRWRRPHLLAIDPSLLKPGENTLLIQTAYRSGVHTLAGVEVGRLMLMSPRYEFQFFFSYTLTWIGATVAAVITLVFGVLWLRRREPMMGLLTAAAALWVLRSSFFLVEAMPVELRLPLRFAYYLANGGFAAAMTIILLRLSGRGAPRVQWMIIGYALFGPVLFLITNQYAAPYLDQLWLPSLIVLTCAGLVIAVKARTERQEGPQVPVLIAMAIAAAAAVHDFVLTRGATVGTSTLALHWAGPILLIALATPMVDRFVRILREAETVRDVLETRVLEC